MAEDDRKGCGCFATAGAPGCAAIAFSFVLLAVLLVEHAFHIFEGTLVVVVSIISFAVLVFAGWWVLKRVLLAIARRMPDESDARTPQVGSKEAQ